MKQELDSHDCHASPMDSCGGCEAILRARVAPILPLEDVLLEWVAKEHNKPDYSFKRTNQCADYPPGGVLIN